MGRGWDANMVSLQVGRRVCTEWLRDVTGAPSEEEQLAFCLEDWREPWSGPGGELL